MGELNSSITFNAESKQHMRQKKSVSFMRRQSQVYLHVSKLHNELLKMAPFLLIFSQATWNKLA
jgi:hypothetical protein